ncbi:MFS transporter [Xenophilus arseniciresistens]|uniref:MFS transporter n=1 Tax=Xenophilus arseniciresistens TaxID=1283306 RepID=A0AAE3NAY2_9BURK|nr:MFS transporter [Xenophilus arseniciresistens]MDA7419005.1 MFS transporter [Xenophilus arseniciresistens]
MSAAAGAPVHLLAAAAFCSTAALRVCDPLLPRLATEFQRSTGETARLIVAFSVAYGLAQLLSGPLADRFGKQRLLVCAVAACGLCAMSAALADSFDTLLVWRAAWGVAAAGIVPLAMAWIGDAVAYEARQATLARLLMGTLSGMVFGQLLGGFLADSAWGWRGAFAVLGLAYGMVGALLWRNASQAGTQTPAAGGGGLGAVLAQPWARVVLSAVFIEGLFLLGALSYLPSYLHVRQGLSLPVAAGICALYAVGGLAYVAWARRIVGALGEVRMVALAGLLMAAALGGLWLLPLAWTAAALALLLGFGTYLFHSTLQTLATQMAPLARGSAMSLFSFSLFGGQALGAMAFGGTIDRQAYATLLLLPAAALAATGLGFAASLRRRRALSAAG